MKKVIYSIGIMCTLFLVSCDEDTGTSTEVVESDDDENVNPDHINAYDRPGTAGTAIDGEYGVSGSHYAAEVSEFKDATAPELVVLYYTRNMERETTLKGSMGATKPMESNAAKAAGVTQTNPANSTTTKGASTSDANTKEKEREVVETQQ